ncbi:MULTISPECIES: DUF4351 domain-containing protein [unclassified Anabaena]|uniref:DUF4351 domain-containing protein n=1 Tax=unclassified Anabaena TaxID=2619674 RepID=UPI001444E3F5|nr:MULTISPECIES: DUF4351 domain-containing protein [unclassified Anabaena]MTJ08220.1 DUF4351 domain-containing protein [Anabaena sp. UHCC 0204]MTJ53453.1 DUF4351 domain-containing protein [Anabaena sp. UHCC 0253]
MLAAMSEEARTMAEWKDEGLKQGTHLGMRLAERIGIKQETELGINLGVKLGMEIGIEIGVKFLLIRQLNKRLGTIPRLLSIRLQELSTDNVQELGEEFLDFSTLEDLEKWVDKKDNKSRNYQEMIKSQENEARKLIMRLLNRRFGTVPQELVPKIEQLSREQIETLAEDLLDFSVLQDLENWLQQHQSNQ